MTIMCVAAANYIIEKTNNHNKLQEYGNRISITGKRLQKILYFSDVEFMKQNMGKSMFKDEYYAWPSGPVIPSVYYEFSQYQNGEMCPSEGVHSHLTKAMMDAIDSVLMKTYEMDTIDLIKYSHVKDGPWCHFYTDTDPNHEQMIPKTEIYSFYKDHDMFVYE